MGDQRRSFTREFKLEAVRLVTAGKRRLSEVARELGIRATLLDRWRQCMGLNPAPLSKP